MKKNLPRNARLILSTLVLASFVLSCESSADPTALPDQIATIVGSSMLTVAPIASPTPTTPPTAIPPTANPTMQIPTTVQPPTVRPPTNPAPKGTQIHFSTGATQGFVEGTIEAGQTLSYYLTASKGQPMIVMVSSPNNDVTLSITTQDRTVLLPASQKSSMWQGTLFATQNYYFEVIGGSSTETFRLSADIPARIQFASGQTSTTLTGRTVNGTIVSYVAYAFAGQTLEVTINTSPEDAALTIWGFSDGQPYARAQNGVTIFTLQLPATQDYIIDVVPQGGRVIDYTLKITIK